MLHQNLSTDDVVFLLKQYKMYFLRGRYIMKRWVVKYTNANTQTTEWVTLNGGTSEKEDSAFMYTKKV
jgi:hypothetical protein